jgi:hypothetical protein
MLNYQRVTHGKMVIHQQAKKKICGFKAQLWKKNDFEASMQI